MQLNLKVVGGDLEVAEVALRLPATLGRGRDVSLSLVHPLVSRQHCELTETDGTVVVRDLGSLNGTYVGSQRVDGSAQLMPGELLTVGTVTFRAVYDLPGGRSAVVVAGPETQSLAGALTEPVAQGGQEAQPPHQKVRTRGGVARTFSPSTASAESDETEPVGCPPVDGGGQAATRMGGVDPCTGPSGRS